MSYDLAFRGRSVRSLRKNIELISVILEVQRELETVFLGKLGEVGRVDISPKLLDAWFIDLYMLLDGLTVA